MKLTHVTVSVFLVIMVYPALTHTKNVQKRFLNKLMDISVQKVREIMRDLYDPKPYEPYMLIEAKRVRQRIGQTLANVTNTQLNDIVIALDRIYLDNDVNPSLSKLVSDVRQRLGDKAAYLTDTEIGNVIYDILCQIRPENDVIDIVKVVTVAVPFFGSWFG